MSLDISIRDKKTQNVVWEGSITHDMGNMAKHIPCVFRIGDRLIKSDLYHICWMPEDVAHEILDTEVMETALWGGIGKMISDSQYLKKYNSSNGCGSYNVFLDWLIDYLKACSNNKDCLIEVWR